MKLADLIPLIERIDFTEGVERQLLSDRLKKRLGIIIAAGGIFLQFLFEIIQDATVLKRLPEMTVNFFQYIWLFLSGQWGALAEFRIMPGMEFPLFVIAVLGLYLLIQRFRFYRGFSEEPFRYTFCINGFDQISAPESGESETADPIANLMHHDLTERLKERIGRLSLIDEAKLEKEVTDKLHSHIYIEGQYAVRKERDGQMVIHVMPRLRIGPPNKPLKLTNSVRYPLDAETNEPQNFKIPAHIYEDVLEQVYASVATEIYQQIKSDLRGKMRMFPTAYLRSVAMFHEAEDFASSNTVDAYNHAIELYRESIRYYDISFRTRLHDFLTRFRGLWRLGVNYQHNRVKTLIGFAKCLIYRRVTSALAGRASNPLFEIIPRLDEAVVVMSKLHNRIHRDWQLTIKTPVEIINMAESPQQTNQYHSTLANLTHEKDTIKQRFRLDPPKRLVNRQKLIFFNTYLTTALTYYYLSGADIAILFLNNARAIAPEMADQNSLYLLTNALIEPELDKKIRLFQQSVEKAPNFEIAQYLFTSNLESRFRNQNEIVAHRIDAVISEYDKVVKLNPGNIAALSAQGYLYWLLNEAKSALKKFMQGKEIKTINRQTFIGELYYGQARIAAQDGLFNESYHYYIDAVASDPGIAAYSPPENTRVEISYFYFITPSILKRYEEFKSTFESHAINRIYSYYPEDIADAAGLARTLLNGPTEEVKTLFRKLSPGARLTFRRIKPIAKNAEKLLPAVETALNSLVAGEFLFEALEIQSDHLPPHVSAACSQAVAADASPALTQRANRVLLDFLFSGLLHPCQTADGHLSPNRTLRDSRGHEFSVKTLDVVHSFVLNEYGNACQNYYIRFGDTEYLNRGIEAYETAVEKYNNNPAIYYNLANAYRWRAKPEDWEKARDCLRDAESYFASWVSGLISLTKSQAEHLLNKMDDYHRDLIKKQAQLEDFETRLETLREERGQTLLTATIRPGSTLKRNAGSGNGNEGGQETAFPDRTNIYDQIYSLKTGVKQPSPLKPDAPSESKRLQFPNLTQVPGRGLEEDTDSGGAVTRPGDEIVELENQRDDCFTDIEAIIERISRLEEDFDNEVMTKMARIMDTTRFSALHKPLKFDRRGGGVDDVIDLHIPPENVDENDISSLYLWAEILSWNRESEDALIAAEKLFEGISQYYPGSSGVAYLQERVSINQQVIREKNAGPDSNPTYDGVRNDYYIRKLTRPQDFITSLKTEDRAATRYLKDWFEEVKPQVQGKTELIKLDYTSDNSLIETLNQIVECPHSLISGRAEYREWLSNTLTSATKDLAALQPAGRDLRRLNRNILEEIFPDWIAPRPFDPYLADMQRLIENWLKQDPIAYASLRWAQDYFTTPQVIRYITAAIESNPDFPQEPHHKWLADLFDHADYKDTAFEKLHQAVRRFPKASIYDYKLAEKFKAEKAYGKALSEINDAIKKAPETHPSRASYYNLQGAIFEQLEDYDQAIKAYKIAIKIHPDNESFKRNLMLLFNRRGNHSFDLADYNTAAWYYQQAIDTFPGDPVLYANLASAFENTRDTARRRELLQEAIAATDKAIELDAHNASYPRRKKRLNSKLRLLDKGFGSATANYIPAVTQIAIEVASNLIPMFENPGGGLTPEAKEKTILLRKLFRSEFGIKIPSLRFRGNDTDMDEGSYLIMLNEVPLVMRTISPEKRFYDGIPDLLELAKIPAEKAENPLTGQDGSWVQQDQWEAAAAAGFTLWEVLDYPFQHLAAVLRSNMVSLVGHQEVVELMNHRHLDTAPLLHSNQLTALTGVIRGLLAEQVPVTEMKLIYDAFLAQSATGRSAVQIVEDIRSLPEIREQLPGNNEHYRFFSLSAALEEAISKSIVNDGNKTIMALLPELCQEILSAVRYEASGQRNIALVTADKNTRPHLRELVCLEFPFMAVLSREELLPALQEKIEGEIKLDTE